MAFRDCFPFGFPSSPEFCDARLENYAFLTLGVENQKSDVYGFSTDGTLG
jgi:hypothetical protein